MISTTVENDIAYIKIDDGKANVISKSVAEDFIRALDEAKQEAKAVVLQGGGDKFCAGFNLATMQQGGQAQNAMITTGFTLLYHLFSHPQPVLAACNGHAIGLGAFFLLCSDSRVGVKKEYKVGLPETAGGMPFTPFLVTIVRETLNRQFINSAALQSQMCTPESAIKAGFLDMLVEPEQLDAAATMGAQQLMQLPLGQYGNNKLELRDQPLALMRQELEKMGVSV